MQLHKIKKQKSNKLFCSKKNKILFIIFLSSFFILTNNNDVHALDANIVDNENFNDEVDENIDNEQENQEENDVVEYNEIPSDYEGLTSTQTLYAIDENTKKPRYIIFDFYNGSEKVLTKEQYDTYISCGFLGESIGYSDYNYIKSTALNSIYDNPGDQVLATAEQLNSLEDVKSKAKDYGNIYFTKTTYVDNKTYYAFVGDNGKHYYVSPQIYYEWDDTCNSTYKHLKNSSDTTTYAQSKGEGKVLITAEVGIDVPTERLLLYFRNIDTFESYNFYLLPPAYTINLSLPTGSYVFYQCTTTYDRSLNFNISGQNSFSATSGQEKNISIKIGDKITTTQEENLRETGNMLGEVNDDFIPKSSSRENVGVNTNTSNSSSDNTIYALDRNGNNSTTKDNSSSSEQIEPELKKNRKWLFELITVLSFGLIGLGGYLYIKKLQD